MARLQTGRDVLTSWDIITRDVIRIKTRALLRFVADNRVGVHGRNVVRGQLVVRIHLVVGPPAVERWERDPFTSGLTDVVRGFPQRQ